MSVLRNRSRSFPLVQWLRTHLPMQGTRVQSWFRKVHEANRVCAKKQKQELPAGPVVKNPPANAGDTGSVLVQEGPHAAGRLSPRTTATETTCLEPMLCSRSSLGPQKPCPAAREEPAHSKDVAPQK